MKHWISFIIVNLAAILLWSYQLCQGGFPTPAIMLNDSDSQNYIDVGHWLFGGPPSDQITIRTFLFPLWIMVVTATVGLKGFFILQLLLWVGSINLLLFALIKIRLPQLVIILISLTFLFNLTLLSISYEVLTETLTVFLSCLYLYCVMSCNDTSQLKARTSSLLVISSLLMLLKPIFEPLFIIMLVVSGYLFLIETKREEKLRKLRWLILSLVLVFVQLFIMVRYVHSFSISGVATLNWCDYFIANGLSRAQHITIFEARKIAETWTTTQTFQFAFHHIPELAANYFNNFHFNISSFPNHVAAIGSPNFEVEWMIWWNRFHFIAQVALPFLLLFSWRKIRSNPTLKWMVIALAIPMYDVILLSSISFGQGDRLVIPAIPFVVALYAILIHLFLPLRWKSSLNNLRLS